MKPFVLFIIAILLSACAPSPQAIQTAVAGTQVAIPTQTPYPTYTIPPAVINTEIVTVLVTETFTPSPIYTRLLQVLPRKQNHQQKPLMLHKRRRQNSWHTYDQINQMVTIWLGLISLPEFGATTAPVIVIGNSRLKPVISSKTISARVAGQLILDQLRLLFAQRAVGCGRFFLLHKGRSNLP